MAKTTKGYSFSLPPDVVRRLDEHGRESGTSNRSKLAERAIRLYLGSAEARLYVLSRRVRTLEQVIGEEGPWKTGLRARIAKLEGTAKT